MDMRKTFIALVVITAFVGAVYAADLPSLAQFRNTSIPYSGNIPVYGMYPRTAPSVCYVDNVARTVETLVQNAGGTYLGGSDNTLTPIAATISCNGNTRWAFQASPSTTVGHYLPNESAWNISGPDAIGRVKGIAAGATDNVSCAITLWY
jgi:type 1 fimbria pilin